MPFIHVDGANGSWDCSYAISTPTKVSAEDVDPDIPTIVFLHGNYTRMDTFQRQFDNPTLRQFNLVTFDQRGRGSTGGLLPYDPFLPSHITDDVWDALEALNLPPCHILGLGMGYYVALDLAARHPGWVLSITICSPLPPVETEQVLEGRKQMYRYFENYVRSRLEGRPADRELNEDASEGAVQLLWNMTHTRLIHAIVKSAWKYSVPNFTTSFAKLAHAYKLFYTMFRDQVPLSKEHLKKVQCPVTIIHFNDDVAYGTDVAEDLRTRLLEAGVQVKPVEAIPGPQYGCLTHPEGFNAVLFNDVISSSPTDVGQFKVKNNSERLETPFLQQLAEFGYNGTEDEDGERPNGFRWALEF